MTAPTPTTTFTANTQLVARQKSEADEKLAVAILSHVAPIFASAAEKTGAAPDPVAFTACLEKVWRWVQSDGWPPPGGA